MSALDCRPAPVADIEKTARSSRNGHGFPASPPSSPRSARITVGAQRRPLTSLGRFRALTQGRPHGSPSGNVVRAHRAPAPVRLLDHLRAQDGGAPPRRGHHRLRHGQPRRPDAAAHRRQARRDRAAARHAWIFGVEGHSAPAPRDLPLVQAALGRGLRSRVGSHRHHRLEGGHRALGARNPRPWRHGAGAEPELPDPHLRAGDRGRRHPPGADDARRGFLRRARAHDQDELSRSRRC